MMKNKYFLFLFCLLAVVSFVSCEGFGDGLSRAQALIAYNQGKWDTASDIYKKLLEKYPDDANLHWRLGTVSFSRGDLLELRRQISALRKLNRPELVKELEQFLEDSQ